MPITLILAIAGAVVAFVLLAALVMARLYRRTTREEALVKTGSGGKKVIMDGGTVVVPFLHAVRPVNMRTLRLEVRRSGENALITHDRMRVDVGVEFYVSVQATEEGISRAAQTLGERTFDVDQLREMIEGKLVDGLRAVAARMTMDQLHEERAKFVQEVGNAVGNDLLKNGLELESVSLTALDQTPFSALDENNAFNAIGMRKLAEVIATSKRERAQIEAEAQVATSQAAMEAKRKTLEIERQEHQARIHQEQEIETLRSAQEAEVARRREEAKQESENARIRRERTIQAAEIERDREIEVAQQERQIVVAQKSEEESRARASADEARALATKAAEAIETARAEARAERERAVAMIEARRDAEREATRVRLQAEAERLAAKDRADAKLEEAKADAEATTIRAQAKKMDLLAEAEGRRAIVEADNAITSEIGAMNVELARLKALPDIVAQMVKPAERIESIRIHHISGGGFGAAPGGGGEKAPVNQAIDSILGMALQLPAMQRLGQQVGLSIEGGMDGILAGVAPASTKSPEARPLGAAPNGSDG